jgi:hypothetical protein
MLRSVQLVKNDAEIMKLTIKDLDIQLDAFCTLQGDSDIPKTKASRGAKADKQNLLKEAVKRSNNRITIYNNTLPSSNNMEIDVPLSREEEEEAEEMADNAMVE